MADHSTAEVARLAGVSKRQLQWWDERGILVADRNGRDRRYSEEQLLEVLLVAELMSKGVSLSKIRHLPTLALAIAGGYVITDGVQHYVRSTAPAAIAALCGLRGQFAVVDVAAIRKQLRAARKRH